MFSTTDQTGHTIQLKETPKRIISLVPSQSELLWELGVRNELVGITKFCVHPEELFRTKERVGGTKKLNIEKIRALKPDLIIGNKEENERSQIEALQKEFNVWMSDIYTLEDSFSMMREIGRLTDKETKAAEIISALKQSLGNIKDLFKQQTLAYFIWNKPYMVAASNTFIDHVLTHLGFQNALAGKERYPEISPEELQQIQPEICFLSSEPFPFKETHVKELQKILPNAKILVVDGEVFSWYGTRLLHLEKYVQEIKKLKELS